jgi:hypothetical protein
MRLKKGGIQIKTSTEQGLERMGWYVAAPWRGDPPHFLGPDLIFPSNIKFGG